jgi:hypothetical protein
MRRKAYTFSIHLCDEHKLCGVGFAGGCAGRFGVGFELTRRQDITGRKQHCTHVIFVPVHMSCGYETVSWRLAGCSLQEGAAQRARTYSGQLGCSTERAARMCWPLSVLHHARSKQKSRYLYGELNERKIK